ncbi:MAG: hypothetical protein R3A78_13485 [Polyangiales bacterium]
MTAEELRDTTPDRRKRQALRAVVDSELETDRVFAELMGKDANSRYRFIMEYAAEANAEELDV